MAAAALAGGSVLAVSASAAPALASTPASLVITTTAPLAATAGSAYVAKLDATGGTKPYSWSLTGNTSLPAGLVLHASTGQITGTPLGPGGTFGFTAEVTDSENPAVSATASESIAVVVNPLTVLTAALPAATAGVAYSQTLTATGGVSPYSWSVPVGALPAGLVLHAASGVISGTPKAGGNFTFTAEVTDSEATPQSAGAPESITVGVAGLVVTTGSTLPTGTSGVPYSVKLSAAGGTTPYAWTLASGSLPAGLKLAKTTGVISGTTTATGQDNFTVQVTDSEAPTVSATENVSLYVVTPMVIPTTLPGASLGASYDQPLQPTGGLGPYSYAITAGALPPGLALQTDGEITGQAAADGTSTFTVSVTDSENPPATVTQAESITVTQPVIYVATDGSDSNAGTQAAPLQTIGGALTLANSFAADTAIDVAGGTYNEGTGINLINNVTINGGFYESTWTQTSSTPTTIVGSPQAVLADGATGASLDDVTLAPTAPSTPGDSVYGLRAIDGSSVSLADVTINTPSITVSGSQGSAGQSGSWGFEGGNGGQGDSYAQCAALSGSGGGGAGGSGGADGGGAGGSGGAGDAGGSCGSSPPPCYAPPADANCSETVAVGSSGGTGEGAYPGYGGPGGTNTIAAAGVTWQGQSGFTGNSGGTGAPGAGGGGGSGAGGCFGVFSATVCDSAAGGGGGGGGGGGAGGGGGYGGGAGGGSFGVYLDGATVTFTSAATITVGNGGPGGVGGDGVYGGGGGSGGAGGQGGYDDGPITNGVYAGQGGAGGSGGVGGQGGGGGGGAGGPSIGIFPNGTVSGSNNVTISVGAGGAGGIPGSGPFCLEGCPFDGGPGEAGLAEAIA